MVVSTRRTGLSLSTTTQLKSKRSTTRNSVVREWKQKYFIDPSIFGSKIWSILFVTTLRIIFMSMKNPSALDPKQNRMIVSELTSIFRCVRPILPCPGCRKEAKKWMKQCKLHFSTTIFTLPFSMFYLDKLPFLTYKHS